MTLNKKFLEEAIELEKRWAKLMANDPKLQAILRGFPPSNGGYHWFLGGPVKEPDYAPSWNYWIDRHRRKEAGLRVD
jgi:hypothetical protein